MMLVYSKDGTLFILDNNNHAYKVSKINKTNDFYAIA
jgi:hypothetical protein